ncbi:NUDIX hydrolase [Actinomadura sp. KC06]|uniref:NUDIX hydrolase n=1 Tax=Actinomadura sp. KC06 TaxID=2530369 RepID=UPI001049B886|nr:NUDIX hydrolase [Actinomadura sp. KC06]TDD25211.1 NUDIX hydrolase [Actinomadura sp. KC06]
MSALTRVSRKVVYTNPWLTVYEDRIKRSGKPGIYGIVERPDAVVISMISSGGSLLMLNSFRYPTGEWSLELPMGGIDPGESPTVAARRELHEETGLFCHDLQKRGWFYALPGLSDQKVHVFSGSFPEEGFSVGAAEQSEEDLGSTTSVATDRLGELYREGRITDSLTLCGLLIAGFRFS